MSGPKIKLCEWAAKHYSPPPSLWTLRRWVRMGEIYPAPELVGRSYYVDPDAKRLTDQPRPSLVDRLKAA
jgi:hypothetical protein